MTNHPMEEKWKEEFDKEFLYWVVLGSTLNDGSELRWNVGDGKLPDIEKIKSFIENLLEQERAERDNFWAKNEESRLKNYEALGYHKGKMAERKRMSEVLTVNLDMSQMLDGWDKYWIDAKNGRYIEGCAECGNSKRIKESIINK